MAKQINVGIGGAVKKVSKLYAGVGGVVKQIKKGVAGVGGVVKTFYESSTITSANTGGNLVNLSKTSDGYLSWNISGSSGQGYIDIYGDFAGKSYSITAYCSGYDIDVYEESRVTTWFSYDETSTKTGTFKTSTGRVRLQQYAHSERSVYGQLRSFKINGEEKLPELLAALGK